ncbi:ATP-dependent DNA ligase [Haliangium ochraceum]|uniref:DNA ligase (ATP) n=1 Tax=Haliangium ochraceum (strain DSM 14365 / JCM 11303 / SMP-2) TaxID=502025 RepID=D0LNZ9_HALO1|nr:ATP-dependent DNA ligase [Haliangium ochraceum]ACY18825.1 ATP dependent DNA ligase [Haliangium ochraceum DSM 14365]
MNLPIPEPVEPMLAKLASSLPDGEGWLYEPKWDGFRVIVFRDGDEILLQSRDKKPLTRYFPELEATLRAQLPSRCAFDGELVIARGDRLDFEALSARIHPAESRIAQLSEETPASLVLWDALCLGDEALLDTPFATRRARLEEALAGVRAPVHLTPITRDRERAADWFARFEGAGLDGVMAKREGDVYQPKKRAMLKIKPSRTAECVIAGFRWHKNGPGTLLGSLLLGLYDQRGRLHYVGGSSSFTAKRREELVAELAPLREGAEDGHPWLDGAPQGDDVRVPGAESRWRRSKGRDWEPLRPERVVEVGYDHMEGLRFRHTAKFVRWRPDKAARACDFEQLDVTPPYELGEIFGQKSDSVG